MLSTHLSSSVGRHTGQYVAYKLVPHLSAAAALLGRRAFHHRLPAAPAAQLESKGTSVNAAPRELNSADCLHGFAGGARRGIIHVPALALGAGKVGAFLSGVAAKKHAEHTVVKWMTDEGAWKVLKSLNDLNDSILASGGQSTEAHSRIASSLAHLEDQLRSMADSDQLRAIKEWLNEVERKVPEFVVAIGHAYLEQFKSVRLAKAFMKGIEPPASATPEQIRGLPMAEWERRVHTLFPELKGYRVILVRKEEPGA